MKKPWFTITKVHQHIFALAEFSHWEQVVSYLVLDKKEAFLIDTGMGYQSIRKEVENLTSLPVTVLLTHAHWDHIGGASEFERVFLYDDAFEKESLQNGFLSIDITELSNKKMYCDGYQPLRYEVRGIQKFETFSDSYIFHSDSFDVMGIHTPGHTPGSVCFWIPQLNSLFTGDTLYPGPLYAQLHESNIDEYGFSIKKLSKFCNPILQIFPGHNAITAGVELLQEASMLFSRIEHSSEHKSGGEIKGQVMSIKV